MDMQETDKPIDDLKIADHVAQWARSYNAESILLNRFSGESVSAKLIQAGLRSETELKKEEERLQIKQQDIANKEKQLQALGEEVANTQANMLRSVSKFIEKYNDNKFDYILAYTSNNISSVLFAKSELEITNEIVDGLNKEYAETKATTKK
jgi:hypothetical protein